MAVLTKKELLELEEYYYWSGYKNWCPFPKDLKENILEVYGVEPSPYTWTNRIFTKVLEKSY